jgi:hypothetical protein
MLHERSGVRCRANGNCLSGQFAAFFANDARSVRLPTVSTFEGVLMSMVSRNNAARALLVRLLEQNLMTRGGLAITLGVGVEELARYEGGEAQMSLVARARLAEAALRVSQSDAELHRRALALRSQVAATRAYESGVTSRLSNAPTLPWWGAR